MKKTATLTRLAFLFIFLLGVGFLLISNYGFVFSHDVKGEIIGIERFNPPSQTLGATPENLSAQKFSFAIAIKTAAGEIFNANSEDREWALVKKGSCVDARFYPYPPWNIERAGTYSNVRMTKILECQSGAPAVAQ